MQKTTEVLVCPGRETEAVGASCSDTGKKGERTISYLPNVLSLLRVIAAAGMLWTKPGSTLFFLLYAFCGLSDILDGWIARKWNVVSRRGQVLDSVGDAVFFTVLLYCFLPVFAAEKWAAAWTLGVVFLRVLCLAAGVVRFHAISFLHTHFNKAAGAVLFLSPLLYAIFGFVPAAVLAGSIATLSAVEELLILLCAKTLDRDRASLFIVGFHKEDLSRKARKTQNSFLLPHEQGPRKLL